MASLLQQLPGNDSVVLRVTHSNIKSFVAEIRFSLEMTLDSVKEKLWKKCGTPVDSMRLELFDDAGAKICDLSDNLRPLGFYSPQDGYRLHIIDLDPSSLASGGWLEDTSLVEKYKISEEAYDKLDSNVRKFKEKLISQNPASHDNSLSDNYMEDLCTNIKVGDRCEVEPGAKRGVVKFLGRAETVAAGFWVGIQLDEPLGKNDGMVKGKRYFDCPPRHGILVRPDKVKMRAKERMKWNSTERLMGRSVDLPVNSAPMYILNYFEFAESDGDVRRKRTRMNFVEALVFAELEFFGLRYLIRSMYMWIREILSRRGL